MYDYVVDLEWADLQDTMDAETCILAFLIAWMVGSANGPDQPALFLRKEFSIFRSGNDPWATGGNYTTAKSLGI